MIRNIIKLLNDLTKRKDIQYKKKRSGPRIEPWGTPSARSAGFDFWQLTDTLKLLPKGRKEENQLRTGPDIPTKSCSLLIKISCSTVSKAVERSNRTRTVHFPASADIITSQDTFKNHIGLSLFFQVQAPQQHVKKRSKTHQNDMLNSLIIHGPIVSNSFDNSLGERTS